MFENIKEEHIIQTKESDGGWRISVVGDYQLTPGWEVDFGEEELCPECAEKSHKVTYTFRSGVEE